MVEEQTFTGANAARFGSPWTTNYDIFETDDQAFQVRLTQILSPTMTNQTSASIGIFDGTHDFGGHSHDLPGPRIPADPAISQDRICRIICRTSNSLPLGRSSEHRPTSSFLAPPNCTTR